MFKILALVCTLTISMLAVSQKKSTPKSVGQKYGCTSLMPMANMKAIDTIKGRGLADQYYLWENGMELRVKFFSGSRAMRDKVMAYAQEWEYFVNLKFVEVSTGDAEIRIKLDNKGGHNSMIGLLCASIPQHLKTMNLDTTDFNSYDAMHRTVLHEFGHAIGFLHEHYSPKSTISWNKELVYSELYRTQGWDRPTVDVNMFQEYKHSYTHGTTYDPTSIMHYPIVARWTTNGYSIPWNNQLSIGDKVLAQTLYPKVTSREENVPRFVVNNYTGMSVVPSREKGGISFYPSFSLTTAGSEGEVYFIMFFYDEEGNPIRDNNDQFNVSDIVATYRSIKFLPGKSFSVNRVRPPEFELFIPFSEIPVASGRRVQVGFRAFLYDSGELKYLFSSGLFGFTLQRPN